MKHRRQTAIDIYSHCFLILEPKKNVILHDDDNKIIIYFCILATLLFELVEFKCKTK